MTSQKRPIIGLLDKPIYLDDAKPGWLKASFRLPRDDSDIEAYKREELRKRYIELDKQLGLKTKAVDIWERRAKALAAREFGIEPTDKDWWPRFAEYLATNHVPGFMVQPVSQQKRGHPRKWTDERLVQLFADVESLKEKFGLNDSRACKTLSEKTRYQKRGRGYSQATLRKAYLTAEKRRNDLEFEELLCGGDAVFLPASGIDKIKAAIKRHALEP